MAAVPNFGDLAQQQAAASNAATDKTNLANRPNQYNPMGSTVWGINPDGTWGQNTSLSGGAQGVFNTSIAGQQNLGSQIAQGLSSDGLMGWGNTDLTRGAVAMPDSGFGASQQVIDAWNSLQQPGLDKNAAAARARAAAMGITLGSRAQGSVEDTIGTNYRQAANEGILRGTQEYQNVFNRGLASRQQTVAENTKQAELINAMRGQQFGERKDSYSAALSGNTNLGAMRDSLNPNSWNPEFKASAGYTAPQIYGAALDTFSANQANENAARQQSNADRTANMGAINTGVGAVNALGGLSGIWGIGKDIFSGAQNFWGSPGSGYSGTFEPAIMGETYGY